MSTSTGTSNQSNTSLFKHSNSMTKLNQNNLITDDPFIVHPGAISSILHLLPTVPLDEDNHVKFLKFKFKLNK